MQRKVTTRRDGRILIDGEPSKFTVSQDTWDKTWDLYVDTYSVNGTPIVDQVFHRAYKSAVIDSLSAIINAL